MAYKAQRFCRHAGCGAIVSGRASYCAAHIDEQIQAERRQDERRGSAHSRGYTSHWAKYSKWFLSLPENQFCKLHIDTGCAQVAQCVDHIDPPNGASDPRFWDRNNHQAACIHCNSVKGRTKRAGTWEFGRG